MIDDSQLFMQESLHLAFFFFQAEDGILHLVRSRGLGDVYKRQKTDPELAESPFIFPTSEWIAEHKIQGFRALDAQEDADYSAMWAKVVGN